MAKKQSRRSSGKQKNQFPLWLILILIAGALAAAYYFRPQTPSQAAHAQAAREIPGPARESKTAANERKSAGAKGTGSLPTAEALLKVVIPTSLPSIPAEYKGFTLSFNPDNHTPNYVAWELLASETQGSETRDGRKFRHEPDLPGCPTTKDYAGSGYDRGHIIPAADQKWHPKAMDDCFSMANMTPQDHALNAGAWATLEEKERVWARRDSSLIIIGGPIYTDSDRKRIGNIGVRVPSAFFKVILAPYLHHPRAIGFVYANGLCPGNMADYAMSVDEVERITGFDFFSALPDDIENDIEANFSFKTWNRR